MTTSIIIILLIIASIWFITLYNRFVHLKNQVDAAWSDISVQLKRRHDLIPKLVDVVKQYAQYEQTVLTRITTLRTEGKKLDDMKTPDLEQSGKLEKNLSQQLQKLIILAEDYPDLKASQHFNELQIELTNVEDTLQHSRRYYNGAVRLLNTRIDTFPDLIVAKLFNYHYRQFFQMDMN
jgi:LemA protein